ncbi:GNAT family N-acetyltransferase [Clavibacter zhangzhiyongii]|uniref:GNAT family N-acetyltransferase n=1 Tax=Clavibacter zhangzhiyongii TaxID=2768071 RepID=A0A7L7Z0N4_9MICO|nr:GNAT family N-acetyltransferase [Clavibacter zhangzhiyongii]
MGDRLLPSGCRAPGRGPAGRSASRRPAAGCSWPSATPGRACSSGTSRCTSSTRSPTRSEVGVTLARSSQGRGIASEALRAVLDLVFDQERAHRVVAACDSRNDAVAQLLTRLGFRRESRQVEADRSEGGVGSRSTGTRSSRASITRGSSDRRGMTRGRALPHRVGSSGGRPPSPVDRQCSRPTARRTGSSARGVGRATSHASTASSRSMRKPARS